MKKIIASILILSLVISGCSRSLVKYSNELEFEFYNRVNKLCEGKEELSIVTKNNRSYKGKKLVLANDSTSFFNIELDSFEKISTDNISQIEFEGTIASGIQGFLFGGLAGGLTANILSNPATGEGWYLGKVIYMSIGILVGGLIGIIYSTSNPGKTKILIKS